MTRNQRIAWILAKRVGYVVFAPLWFPLLALTWLICKPIIGLIEMYESAAREADAADEEDQS